jgi:hypothetical protein
LKHFSVNNSFGRALKQTHKALLQSVGLSVANPPQSQQHKASAGFPLQSLTLKAQLANVQIS